MYRRVIKIVLVGVLLGFSTVYAKTLSDSDIQNVLQSAYNKYKTNQEGKNADYIQALAEVDASLFGISIVMADGRTFDVGDTKSLFSIQSISKVFTVAKVMDENGPKMVQNTIGVNATGLPFNSIIAIELHDGSASNPFVNAGAIQSTSWVKADNSKTRWIKIKKNMDAYAGHELGFNDKVYQSELGDNKHNQAIAKLLDSSNRMGSDPLEATTVYTKQCSVNVTSHDLAVMGATLSNHGLNPITSRQVITPSYTPYILSIMATAGLYDTAGDWLYATGTPAKSGVGGGILAVVPGVMGIGVFSPRLDGAGNSVKGQLAAKYIIQKLNINPYAK